MLSTALINVLAAGRSQFNARVAEARRRNAGFDTAAFGAFVRSGIDPVVQAVNAVASERTARTTVAAYDIALELVSQRLAGPDARLPWVNRVWDHLAPRYASLLAAEPEEVLGSLTNAVVHLSRIPGVSVDRWIALMVASAPSTDKLSTLQALGQIAAWRSGMAHYRDGALRMAETLPEATALLAVGAAENRHWSEVSHAHRANPWWDEPAGQARTSGIEYGQFTGLGGAFVQPPEVRASSTGFVVRSGERLAYLIADAYGAVLMPATAAQFDNAAASVGSNATSLTGSLLRIGSRQYDLDLPADGLALTCNAHTVAVTSPYTHAIRLLPLSA